MPSRDILILTYHSLDESRSVVSISPPMFKKQMEFLWEKGYQTLSLSELINCIHQKKLFPEKTFVINFDDGYKNTYTEAFPVLKEFGFKGTAFLITDYCGGFNDWPGETYWIERRPLLSWSEIKEMHKYGFEFGAHTLTHPDLTQIPIERAEQEIIQSKAHIQDHLGVDVQLFAYPYGKYNSKVKEIVQKQFYGACSTKLGKVKSDCDPYKLKRIDMYYLSSYKLFSALSTKPFDWYLGIRQVFREVKMSRIWSLVKTSAPVD